MCNVAIPQASTWSMTDTVCSWKLSSTQTIRFSDLRIVFWDSSLKLFNSPFLLKSAITDSVWYSARSLSTNSGMWVMLPWPSSTASCEFLEFWDQLQMDLPPQDVTRCLIVCLAAPAFTARHLWAPSSEQDEAWNLSDVKICLPEGIPLFRCSRLALNGKEYWRGTLSAKTANLFLVPWPNGSCRRRPDEASTYLYSALLSASLNRCWILLLLPLQTGPTVLLSFFPCPFPTAPYPDWRIELTLKELPISSSAINSPPECPCMARIWQEKFLQHWNRVLLLPSQKNQVKWNQVCPPSIWNARRSFGPIDFQWTAPSVSRPARSRCRTKLLSFQWFCIPESSLWLHHR